MSINLNPRRSLLSWAHQRQRTVALILALVGFIAVGVIRLFRLKGSLGLLMGGLAAIALLFSMGFSRNRGPIFPPSEITRQNRWKYLILTAILWAAVVFCLWYFVPPISQ